MIWGLVWHSGKKGRSAVENLLVGLGMVDQFPRVVSTFQNLLAENMFEPLERIISECPKPHHIDFCVLNNSKYCSEATNCFISHAIKMS